MSYILVTVRRTGRLPYIRSSSSSSSTSRTPVLRDSHPQVNFLFACQCMKP